MQNILLRLGELKYLKNRSVDLYDLHFRPGNGSRSATNVVVVVMLVLGVVVSKFSKY